MNCLESRHLLQHRLDGEPIDQVGLNDHLAGCADCLALHAAAGRLQEGLRLLVPAVPPAGLSDRIVARVLAARRARRQRRWLLAGAALAASLLIAVVGFHQWPRPIHTPLSPDSPTPVVVVPAPEPPAPSLRASVAEAGSAVVSLTWRTTDETVSQTRRLLPAVSPPPLDDSDVLTQPLDPPARSLREAGHGVSVGLEPVANSARRAFSMFLREVPPMAAEEKPGL